MKDGAVITNPPKGDPNIVKPEGPVDHAVRVYAFERDGELAGLFVDANNHSDTTGGELISADWPGAMAAAINRRLSMDVPVLLLNGLAGNINHFDPANTDHQCSREEAVRIGTGYAEFAMQALAGAREMEAMPLRAESVVFDLPYRDVTDAEIAAARKLLTRAAGNTSRRLTSEELAKGDPQIERMYAQGMLDFADLRAKADSEEEEIAGFRLGDAAFVGFPGEPFVEIGLEVREQSPFAVTTVFELMGDIAGYIPMPECFERGGYEPRTHVYNRFAPDAAGIFAERVLEVLARLRGA